MIRILLVDDQNLVQQGIKLLLEQDSELKVIGTVKDGRNAVKQTNDLCPDIVLLDIEMPGMDGITATKYITHLSPKTKVIILSSHEDKKYLTQALMAGAKAYILKSSLMTDLKQSIIAVNNGYSQIESRLLAKIFDPSNLKLRNSRSPAETKKANSSSRNSQPAIAKKVKQTKKNEHSSEIKAISVSPEHKSILSQNQVSQVEEPNFVVMKQPDLIPAASFMKSEDNKIKNQVNISDLKPLKVVPKFNLPESTPLVKNSVQFDSVAYSGSDETIEFANSTSQFLPAVIIECSATEISRTSESKLWHKLSTLTLKGKNNFRQIMNQPRLSKYSSLIFRWYRSIRIQSKPIIKSSKTKSVHYWHQLSLLAKQWHEKGWLANIGLIFLGLITVSIVHLMFS